MKKERIRKIPILRYSLLALLAFEIVLYSCNPDKSKDEREAPNIIFIMSDDHTTQAMGSYGSRINETPHMDRLANEGMRFDYAYCTNGICAPSRAVILTGKHSHMNGILNNSQSFNGTQQTLPKILKTGGYQTAMVGKWHLKSSPTGFDYWIVLPGQGLYYNPDFIEMGERKNFKGYVTDLTTDFALSWLDKRDTKKPFFMMLHHKAPHRNWMPGPEHLDLYKGRDIPIPKNLFDDYQTRSDAAREQAMTISDHMTMEKDLKFFLEKDLENEKTESVIVQRLKKLDPVQRDGLIQAYLEENVAFANAGLEGRELVLWKYQRYIKDYLRCVASVDDNIGRLLQHGSALQASIILKLPGSESPGRKYSHYLYFRPGILLRRTWLV